MLQSSEPVVPMPDGEHAQTGTLSDTLKLLADPNRLELLEQLREPKIIDEITLTPSRASKDANPDRQLTRQAVRHHIRQLRDEGLIEVSPRRRSDGRNVSEFRVNEQAFYGVVEKLRELNQHICQTKKRRSTLREAANDAREDWPPGPKLVLVRGLHDGDVFPMNESTVDPPRGWVIGRSEECNIDIGYDPAVAHENTEILQRDGGFRIIDLRSSKHRTLVNGAPLPFGGEAELEHGDIIEVGSSVFVFHAR